MADTGPLTAQLRTLATGLLEEKKVEVVLGWEKGTVGYRPLFARTAEQAARLEIDARALLNLVSYLRNLAGRKTAVVVRPADMRALNVLLHEGQVKREELFLIGLGGDSGRGPLPASAYDALLGRAPEIDRRGACRASRRSRRSRAGPRRSARPSGTPSSRAASAATPAARPARSATATSAWPSSSTRRGSRSRSRPARRRFFHVMRAFHQAGRCTGCKACADACPAGIPIGLLNQKVAKDVERLFGGYDTGLDPAKPLPFTTFRKDESFTGCRHE